MVENYFENAVGFQVFDAPVGGTQTLIGSGTFNNGSGGPIGTYTPTNAAPANPASAPSWTQPLSSAGSLISSVKNSLFGTAGGAATPAASAPGPGAASGPGATGANPTPVTTGGSTNPTQSDTASAATPGTLQNYFMRAVIIIVGFIFLAVGLNMLKPGIVPDPRDAVR
jgi:hypothetical protein